MSISFVHRFRHLSSLHGALACRLNLPSGEVGRGSGRVGIFFMCKLKIFAKLIALSGPEGPEGPTLPKGELVRVTNLVFTS